MINTVNRLSGILTYMFLDHKWIDRSTKIDGANIV